MHENLNISGTSNHRGWWVVGGVRSSRTPSALPECPKMQWAGGWGLVGWGGFGTNEVACRSSKISLPYISESSILFESGC